jgi:AcrR family transcriptional regulator
MASSARERVLDAARELLLAGGPNAVSVHAIAACVGLTPPALYKHFASRDAVLDALYAESWALFRAELEGSLRARTALGRLLRCGERYVAFGLRERPRYRLLFVASKNDFERGRGDPRSAQAGKGLELLVRLIDACKAEGTLGPRLDSHELAMAYWASCHGLVSLYLDGGGAARFDARKYERFARRALATLLEGSRAKGR